MCVYTHVYMALPSGSVVKNPPANAGETGDVGLMPGGGNSNPLQYSCVENLMDSGAWRATVPEVTRVRHDLATKETAAGLSVLAQTQ